MSELRCECWKPSAPHEPECPIVREAEREIEIAARLLAEIRDQKEPEPVEERA